MQKKGLFFGTIAVLLAASFGLMGCKEEADAPRSGAKDIIAFSVNNVEGAIDEEVKRISVTLPAGTGISALTPVAVVSTAARIIDPFTGEAIGEAGKTANQTQLPAADFANGKNYVVKAQDGSTKVYHVEVIIPAKSGAKDVIAFSINETEGVIDEATKRIYVTLPAGTDLTALTPVAVTSDGARIIDPITGQAIGSLNESRETLPVTDFTKEKNYIVKAEDGAVQIYSVIVTAPIAQASLDVTIGLPADAGEQPVVYGIPEGGVKLSLHGKTQDLPKVVVISVDAGIWTSVTWYIDGTLFSSANIIKVQADGGYTLTQPHTITFTGYKDGTQYSKTIDFTVEK
jgi:hypothetical protein